MKKIVRQQNYLKELIDVIGTPDIKVITGVRRSGKSKLLEAFINYIKSSRPFFVLIASFCPFLVNWAR